MVRCADFYEKWKKDPNWCQKSPQTVRLIDFYLELVDSLEQVGANAGAIYRKFPEGTAREIFKIKDENIKQQVIKNAAGMINRGEKVSVGDIKVWSGTENATIVKKPSPKIDVKSEPPEPTEPPKTLTQSVGFTVRSEPATVKQSLTTQTPPSIPPTPAPVSADPIKQKRFMMDWHAEECVKLMSPTVQTMVMDILRENRSWKTADAIYFGIQVLAEQKKKR